MKKTSQETGLEIAVIGMTGRFPAARNLEEYWDNLKNGVEAIIFYGDEELTQSGIGPETLSNPQYVRAHGELDAKDYFDHSFFGYSPKEAEIMDPQIRVFHECAWEALETAGYDPTSFSGAIGIYGGASDNFTWRALEMVKGLGNDLGFFGRAVINNGFFLSTRVSHKLNLRGPSLTFFTACSTSLVAIHLAGRALLMGECDMALAGGVAVINFSKVGYQYEEGMIFSIDGHCRSFDVKAKGSVYGEGAGMVVLKRLKDAVKAGDTIHAVIKSTAVSNDGTNKASFTAPGSGIFAAVSEALQLARVKPGDISYVEAHGTATPIGDTLELKALIQAFKHHININTNIDTNVNGKCRIGSVKTNIGHLDAASGIAAFIKTVLSLKHKMIPPSLHFETPNPDIDFENSPFRVNNELSAWSNGDDSQERAPLMAGINAFGIGGNNAFIVLEEAPEIEPSDPEQTRQWKILQLSARSETALAKATGNLKTYLETHPEVNLADAAFTLQTGRKPFHYRRSLVCRDRQDAVNLLSTPDSRKVKTFLNKVENREIIFMFPGLGSQYVKMGAGLYGTETEFRREMDHCFEILTPLLGYDIKEILYPADPANEPGVDSPGEKGAAQDRGELNVNQTEIAQIVIFIFEYALARLLIRWGIKPQAMIGYSFGEYVAACISGVLSLDDALGLIVYRGQLIKKIPAGLMLSVPLPKAEVIPLLPDGLAIGIDNGPSCVLSGPSAEIEAFETKMKEMKCLCMRLPVSHAIHSEMMAPILAEFKDRVRQVALNNPRIPYVSNVTGSWAVAEEVTDPGYWANHLGGTVRFADGIRELVKKPGAIFIEVGPGHDLSVLVQRYLDKESPQQILNLIPNPGKDIPDVYFLLSKIGQLWLYGTTIDWQAFYGQERRQRISLPTYPFDRQQFLVEGDPFRLATEMLSQGSAFAEKADLADWFYIPSWKRARDIELTDVENEEDVSSNAGWLIFAGEDRWGKLLVKHMQENYPDIILIREGTAFARQSRTEYMINPGNDKDYDLLFNKIKEENGYIPGNMMHLWNMTEAGTHDLSLAATDRVLDLGYYCLLNIAKVIGRMNISDDIQINVITNNLQEVGGEKLLCPEKATVLGPVKGIPKEYVNIRLRSIDVDLSRWDSEEAEYLVDSVIKECVSQETEPIIALRNHYRWLQIYEPVRLSRPGTGSCRLKDGGVYVITGGLGGIGYALAEYIARTVSNTKLIMIGRTKLPEPGEWDQWLETHDEDDSVSDKIRKVRGLEQIGAEVFVGVCQASDLGQVQEVMTRAEEQFGPVNGILHSAGIPDGAMIQVRTRENSEIVFSSKVKGTMVLEEIFKDAKLDFFAICSSLDSVVSNAGHVGYCAANSFINAYAHYKTIKSGIFSTAINWPRWKGTGMAIIQEKLHMDLKGYDLPGGLSVENGVDAYDRILGASYPQVAVNMIDLGAIYELDKTVGTEAFMEEFDTAEASDDRSDNLFQRPDLTSQYEAPQNEIQQSLVKIWQRLFGVSPIGIRDDFFELGGDSLKVVIAISKIHKELDIEIPVSEFFNTPNIRDLARYIKSDTGESSEVKYFPINPVEKKEYYALSSAQRRLYIIQQMEPESVVYNETKAAMVRGKFDKTRLEEAFRKLIARQEIYRTSIRWIDGQPYQRVHAPEEIEAALHYFQCTTEGEARELVMGFSYPFNLGQAPMLRVGFITMSEDSGILMIDTHHIITDKTSDGIQVKELLSLYMEEELPVIPVQYRDYAEWQNSRQHQDNIKKQEEYWLKQFEGEIPVLSLSYDYPRPAVQTFTGDGIMFILTKEQLDPLKALASKHDVTLYMVLLAIFNIFLGRLSGLEDLVIGTPVSGRRRTEIQSSVGIFINMLALRNFPCRDKTVKEFLGEIRAATLKAFDNQDYPIEDIIDRVDVNRDMSRSPLFDVIFVLQNMEERPDKIVSQIEIPGFTLSAFGYEVLISKYDLVFEFSELPDALACTFQYCTNLFKRETIERFATYFRTVASLVVEETDRPIWQLEILSEAERKQVLYEFNDTETVVPTDKFIHQLFAEQVERTPDRIAAVVQSSGKYQAVTYREISNKSRQLGYSLKERGVEPGAIVGIMLERSLEMVAGILGILKAGGAYLPIDPGYPEERRQYMLKDSGAEIVLTRQEIAAVFSGTDDKPEPQLSLHPCLRLTPVNWLAYIIYTSGSTGKPKGAMINQLSVVNILFALQELYPLGESDAYLLKTSYVFDVSVTEIFGWFWQGGRLVVLEPGGEKNPESILAAIEQNRVTHINFVPSMFQVFVQVLKGNQVNRLSSLRYIFLAGEVLRPEVVNQFDSLETGIILENIYGPTEGTIYASKYSLTPGNGVGKGSMSIPIGKPMANINLYILDNYGLVQPIGLAGELCISGAAVARGYLNQPEHSAEKFITQATNLEKGNLPANKKLLRGVQGGSFLEKSPPGRRRQTIYKTGDLVRWLADGNIEFLDRIDNQVKIRGFRIELGEIENRLIQHDNITEAVVSIGAMKGDPGATEEREDIFICAYFVSDKELTVPELKEFLLLQLPGYMVPAYFVPLEKIPLTPGGKIDRKALPLPLSADQRPKLNVEYIAPKTVKEKIIAGIWMEILKLGKLGIHDNFFDIGGNSLKLIQVNNRLKEELKIDIPVVKMFEYPTIKSFLTYLAMFQPGGDGGKEIEQLDIEYDRGINILEQTMQTIEGNTND